MKTKLKSLFAVALCAVGLTASALQPSPFRDFWSSHPDPQPVKDPANVIDWGTASMTFESYGAKHGKFLAASADAMIAAYTARIEKDPTDCEAHISRALAYLKKAGENKMFDDLAKEFGYTFDNDTMHWTGELIHEKGKTPEMNDASDEVCDILLPLLKAAYEDLCAIPKNWKGSVAITPDVYPVDEAAYFDYADSLGARAALAELMCVLNMVKGFDVAMDSDKLEDTFNAINQSNGKRGVQALFENNPEFFSKVRDQKALTEAGDWWASAATLLDQWDKAHCRRSDDKLHFFDWNYEKLDSNGKYGVEWCQRQSAELANLPYWASPLDYTKINGEEEHFTSFKPLFEGKFLRKDLPEFGVGVKAPYCNEPLIDTLPDSTLCGIWPSVSPIYFATYVSTRWTDIPPFTTNTTASVYGVWYKNMFTEGGIGFENTGNPLTFAWDNATPITLLDPEFNVRGVTAVFKGWSGVMRNFTKETTWEGSEIPTPIKEPAKYVDRRVELTAHFDIPQVTYRDFDETAGKPVERTAECEIVTEKTTTLTTGKVYVVVGDVTLANRIKVLSTTESPAKLVLCDEATLAATKGVEVAADNALTLCGQALGTGTLEATGSEGAAGIGGGGTVTINGGTVVATGGSSSAGIGGGTVTINGGTVTAAGSDGAAGIGGTVKFGANYACGVAAGADESSALYRAAAAFTADHSAAYVALPYFSLKIPEATEGYSYEVSYVGVQPKAALADKVNTYAIATGATVRVRFTFDGEDYVWVKEPADNPMIIANISGDTVVDAADLPTAKFSKKGSAGNPWAVGKTTLDSVTAYTSGAGGLVVEGEGDMQDFTSRDPAPWGTGVSEVEIGEDVTSIGARAFADSQLERVTIPASVTNIGAAAFAASTSLSSVAVEAMTPPALGKEAFVELAEDYKIYVPQGTVETYKAAPGWRDYADRIVEGIPGSPVWPWKVGAPKAADVTAYTNGVGKLVVEGWGDIRDFDPPSDSAPWGTDIAEVKIDEDVTSIGANAFADCMSLTNMVVEAMTPPVLGDDALSGCAAIETIYVPYGTSGAYKAAPGWSDFAENIVELPEPIAAESDEFTVDLRPRFEFDKGKTRIDVVTWSATAWGAVPGSKYTDLGFTNLTTGASGVIAEGLVGENWDDCPLPEKDGEYLLTHSTGDLKSFVTFVVSGYPIGTPTNPWLVGPDGNRDGTVAWKDNDAAIVYLKPPRSAVSRAGLETLTNAMGGVNFAVGLVTADGTATNEVKMIIGASGKQYTSLEEMLESDEDSWTLYDVMGCVVSYDGMGHSGTMASDTFLPGVPTNLTANAYTAFGYAFQGWTTNGDTKVIFEDEAAIDDPQPGDIYDLKAVWKLTPVSVGKGVTAYLDENGVLHIKGKGAMKDFTDKDPAPWAEFAPDIKAIEVEEGVTKIGNAAFAALDYKDTTSTLSVVDDTHVLNLLAFVSADGSETNAPWTSQFRVVRDGTVESVAAFGPKGSTAFYGSVEEALTYGDMTSMLLLTLAETAQREKDYLTATAGEKPYSKAMQDLLDAAFKKLKEAEGYGDVVDVDETYADKIEEQAAKDKTNAIEGTKITWRVMDGTLVISGEGEMPDFVEPDFPDGAPWNVMKDDITNVTVAAGITFGGDASFAVCPAFAESSVLFKDPEIVLNLGAFVSGDGSVTNVPAVKVEIVTEDGRTLRVVPGKWANVDDPNKTYVSVAEAVESGACAVIAVFEEENDEEKPVVIPPVRTEEVRLVEDPEQPGKTNEVAAVCINGGDRDDAGREKDADPAIGTVGKVTGVIEGLCDIVDNTGSNIFVMVSLTNKSQVASGTVAEMDQAMSNELKKTVAEIDRFASYYLDISAWAQLGSGDPQKLTEFAQSVILHVPMRIYEGIAYTVSRMHNDETEILPNRVDVVDGDTAEWVEADVENQELIVKIRKFCDVSYGVAQPPPPLIGATVDWKLDFSTGRYFAQLQMSVTSGCAVAVRNLEFQSQDRENVVGGVTKADKLYDYVRKDFAPFVEGGGTMRHLAIPATEPAYVGLTNSPLNTKVVYGLIDATLANKTNGKVPASERKLALYVANAKMAELNEYTRYLTWTAFGDSYAMVPVAKDAPATVQMAQAKLSSVMLASAKAGAPLAGAALPAAVANKALAFGNAYLMDGSDPDCEIAEFEVGEGLVRGRIALKGADGAANAPGANVVATLYGATSLEVGAFASCGMLELVADGTFETPIPEGKAFFRVKLEVVDVIK